MASHCVNIIASNQRFVWAFILLFHCKHKILNVFFMLQPCLQYISKSLFCNALLQLSFSLYGRTADVKANIQDIAVILHENPVTSRCPFLQRTLT